ncbi:MAG: hypothetical protein EA421_02160 [Gemmatimonadales bacterium]|nr:MAG: hypothetical protein EA421_02160 [Gemmatimonadales bacterium]
MSELPDHPSREGGGEGYALHPCFPPVQGGVRGPYRVLSGYAEGSPRSRWELPSEFAFILNPFTPEALLRGVGELLEWV